MHGSSGKTNRVSRTQFPNHFRKNIIYKKLKLVCWAYADDVLVLLVENKEDQTKHVYCLTSGVGNKEEK